MMLVVIIVKLMLLLAQSITPKTIENVFVDFSILGDVFLSENITNSQLNVNSFMI